MKAKKFVNSFAVIYGIKTTVNKNREILLTILHNL